MMSEYVPKALRFPLFTRLMKLGIGSVRDVVVCESKRDGIADDGTL